MPARVTVTFESGQTITQEIPVETWLSGDTTAVMEIAGPEVIKVEIDAEGVFPDIDRSNNIWEKERG
jgi:hypothetical protein